MAWALVIAAVVSLAAGGGVAYAADAAVPGDTLYGVDLAMEEVRLSLTSDSEAIFDYQLDRAEERLGEAKKLAASGDTENLSEALSGYGEAFAEAAKQAGKAGENAKGNAVRTRLDEAVAMNNEEIGNLNPGTPASDGIQVTLQDRDAYCSFDEEGNLTLIKTHSVADKLADGTYSADQITTWFCQGYGLGEIMHAIAIAAVSDADAASLLGLREVGTGWGNIMRDMELVGNLDSPGGRPEDPGTGGPRMDGSKESPEDPGKPEDAGAWKEDPMGPGEGEPSDSMQGNQPDEPGKLEDAGNSGESGNGGNGSGGSGSGPRGGTGTSPLEMLPDGEEAPGQGGAGAGAGGGKGN